MAIVIIPFRPEWREKMLTGKKTATSRPRRYGQPGDKFEVFGATFELLKVVKMPLVDVTYDFYKLEGCDNPEDFRHVWRQIHPRRGYIGTDEVWLHTFKRSDNDT